MALSHQNDLFIAQQHFFGSITLLSGQKFKKMISLRGCVGLCMVGCLFLSSSPSAAFAPLSTQKLPRAHSTTRTPPDNIFWPAHSGRAPVTSYMSDSASTTAEGGENVSTSDSSKGFLSRITAAIPPAAERQKLIPLGIMFFCILFNYTILRDTKDVLMVRHPRASATTDKLLCLLGV